jgi:hypothetical protein
MRNSHLGTNFVQRLAMSLPERLKVARPLARNAHQTDAMMQEGKGHADQPDDPEKRIDA